jgi:Na+/H+ antiporter NhaD/arsenite permease-like protein
MIVIAANAGGAWSPIGDVTTTMLWIGGQITTQAIIKSIFIPSVVAVIIPLLMMGLSLKGNIKQETDDNVKAEEFSLDDDAFRTTKKQTAVNSGEDDDIIIQMNPQ